MRFVLIFCLFPLAFAAVISVSAGVLTFILALPALFGLFPALVSDLPYLSLLFSGIALAALGTLLILTAVRFYPVLYRRTFKQ